MRYSMNKVMLWLMFSLACAALAASTKSTLPAFAAASPEQTHGIRRLALLIGISKYQQVTSNAWKQLHTRLDVAELRRVLLKPQYGFQDQDIRVLEDRAATAEGIRQAVKEHLIGKAAPGAIVILYFSGHGQQVHDQDGDEIDGLDESLVPYDATVQHESEAAKVNILDDEIATWLRQIEAKLRRPDGKVDGSINVILDSCYSGTATRGTLVERGRGWDEAFDGPKPPARGIGTATVQTDHGMREVDGDYFFLSASQSDQRAREVGDRGLFTRALISALERASDRTTYRTLLREVTAEVMAEVRDQIPQLEGNPDQRLFGGQVLPRPPYVPVTRVQGRRISLPIGSLQMVSVGSMYSIYRPGDDSPSEQTRLADSEVISVSDLESELRCPHEVLCEKLVGARAVERVHNYSPSSDPGPACPSDESGASEGSESAHCRDNSWGDSQQLSRLDSRLCRQV